MMTADEAVDCLHVFEARIRPLSEIEGETYMKQLKNPQDHFHEDEVLTAIGVIAERKARMAENGKTDYRFTMDDALRIVAQERLAAAARAKAVRPAAVESPEELRRARAYQQAMSEYAHGQIAATAMESRALEIIAEGGE